MTADRPRGDAEALRALLARQSQEVAAGALHAGGQVPAERLDDLARLARLVEMRQAATRPVPKRWLAPVVAVGTLVCASVLLFTRVRGTEVEMELVVSGLSFVVPQGQAITNDLNVSGLGVSGLKAIEVPGGSVDRRATDSAASMSAAPERVGRRAGTVSVNAISVPQGARVSLRKVDGPRPYWINIRGATSGLAVSVSGPVRLVVSPVLNEVRDFPFPQRIVLVADSNQVTLDFATAEAADQRATFPSLLPADSLFLYRIDQVQWGEQTVVRQVPTIQSGTLYFESLNGEARPLRAGEGLNLEQSSGEMRELRLADDGIQLRFHGTVRGMTAGSGDVRRSLMPTRLDWLRARHGLWLLWGTTVSVVGVFTTIFSWFGWWRRPA